MKDVIADIMLNPARMRILQFLMVHQPATVFDISQTITDIPKPSLYRHLKKMVDHGLLIIIEENRIRGTVEKVYGVAQNLPIGEDLSPQQQLRSSAYSFLMSVLGEFERYSQQENADPVQDMLLLSTSNLLLSDQEYADLLQTIGSELQKILDNKPNDERKLRRLSMISSPTIMKET